MKYDYDAINILRGVKTIYLRDKQGNLVFSLPVVSEAFAKKFEDFSKGRD